MLRKIIPNSFLKVVAILIIGLIVTIIATIYTKNENEKNVKREYTEVCNEIKTKIATRLQAHAQLLQTGAAFFAATDTVTRQSWKTFVEQTNINNNLPGIQGFGYIAVIPKNQLQGYINKIRKEGFPKYDIYPKGDRDFYTSVIYVEPLKDRNLRAFGYDVFTEPVRRKALEIARDSNMITLTGKVKLVQETNEDVQAGTLMFVPVYKKGYPINNVEQRRLAIKGWVYNPYRMNDLMTGILGRWDLNQNNRIHLRIYDDSVRTNSILFDSQKNDSVSQKENRTRIVCLSVDFNGKKWILYFNQLKEQNYFYHGNVLIVFLCGIFISLLLFLLFLSLFNTSKKAQEIAEQLTVELKESEENLNEAQKLAEFGNWSHNFITNKNIWSENCFAIYGLKPYEISPTFEYFRSRVHPDDAHLIDRDFELMMKNSLPITNTIRILLADGTFKWILCNIVPIIEENNMIEIKGTMQDITERKKIEIALTESEAKQKALNATKDKFFSIIAHDLRSPFNAIMGFSDLLIERMQEKDYEGIEQYAKIIHDSSGRTMNLINNLLTWSYSQTGKIEFNPEYEDAVSLINEIVQVLNVAALQKSIRISKEIHHIDPIYADKSMISAILRNLISNAIKFTNKGGRIVVSVSKKEKDVVFCISDNGVGISKEDLKKLFRIEESYSKSGTEQEKGTGLGLILCKEFIDKHNGKIWAESEESKGSSFYFSLPDTFIS